MHKLRLRQNAMGLLGRMRLRPSEFQVFGALLGRVIEKNISLASVKELAKDTGLSISVTSRAMRRLAELGVIYRRRRDYAVYLNPYILWQDEGDELKRIERGKLILESSVQAVEEDVTKKKKKQKTEALTNVIAFPSEARLKARHQYNERREVVNEEG